MFAHAVTNKGPELPESVPVPLPGVLISNQFRLVVDRRDKGPRDDVGARPASEVRVRVL